VYSEDRKGIRPAGHLASFQGVLQVDGYAGFKRLGGDRADSSVQLAFCWVHMRRAFYQFHASTGSTIAAELLARVASLYAIVSHCVVAYAVPSLGDRSFNGFLLTYSQYGATFRPAKSIEGFDIALHEEPASNRNFGANIIYFAPPYPGHSSTSLECAEKSPFPVCQARFSSDKYEGLTMAVSTSAYELHDWRTVQDRIVSLVDGGVVSLLH
jgi:hypothetical protein